MTELIHQLCGETMGTTWSVLAVGAAAMDLNKLHLAIQKRLDGVVSEMSNWDEHSVLSRYNHSKAGTWHPLPQGFAKVLRAAMHIAEQTDGAFDPTLGAVVNAWGFGDAGACAPPSQQMLQDLTQAIGWQRLRWQGDDALWQDGSTTLDLCGIAKGHGVDVVGECMRQHGVGSALIEVGGELLGLGCKPDGSPWRVLVEDEAEDVETDAPPAVLELQGLAVATSGSRWFKRRIDDQEYSHTIAPHSGVPVVDGLSSVTVVMPSAMLADGWATALMALGWERGHDVASAQGLAARFVDHPNRGAEAKTTKAFEALLAKET